MAPAVEWFDRHLRRTRVIVPTPTPTRESVAAVPQ
ncbi:hypothetical protein DFR70_101496 [Nocardia tenerifensis]|uniref:Uncharacterized protein n=1 Tax=Nocardia tenerifensis TaxID=228006 RepID=A0A318KDV2_9NOCA|nr:hypothetical protein DFR70_101496 [Nocardia tenerifensis]